MAAQLDSAPDDQRRKTAFAEHMITSIHCNRRLTILDENRMKREEKHCYEFPNEAHCFAMWEALKRHATETRRIKQYINHGSLILDKVAWILCTEKLPYHPERQSRSAFQIQSSIMMFILILEWLRGTAVSVIWCHEKKAQRGEENAW